MNALAVASVGLAGAIPASTRSWEEQIRPGDQGIEQPLLLTNAASSEPQNFTIIPINNAELGLLPPLSAPVLQSGVCNVSDRVDYIVVTYAQLSGTDIAWWRRTLGTSIGPIKLLEATGYYSSCASSAAQTLAGRGRFVYDLTPTDALVAELEELRELPKGWDGEGAEAPIPDAVAEAVMFVRSVGDYLASRLEPTPDVDGSMLLEIGDGSRGSLRFRGDHTIICAIRGVAPGIVVFDGEAIPEGISNALIGMSVFRDGLASDDEILTAAKQLVHNARAAALRQGKNKDKNVGVFGVLRMSCGEIRSFRLAGEPDPSYCVYDTATRAAPAHADAFQRIANGRPEVVDARRNALFECLKAGFVSVDQFRGGLLKSLAPERVS